MRRSPPRTRNPSPERATRAGPSGGRDPSWVHERGPDRRDGEQRLEAQPLALRHGALVDFGATALQSQITHALGPASTNGFCFPGPCGSSRGQWIDLVTITASGVPDGTIGSFTAQLVVDGAFDAVVPLGWNFQSASVFGEPFSLEVDGFAEASLSRGINASGTPTVTTDLALTWEGLVRVNGAAGLGGDGLPPGSVQVATTSGVD